MTEQPLTDIEEHPLDPPTAAEDAPPAAPDVTTVRDAVAREAVLGALLDQIKAEYTTTRAHVQTLLDQQYKATGTTKVDALIPGGIKVGSISRMGGERAAQVTDEDTFRAWVRDTYPTEHIVEVVPVQILTSVQPGFVAKILAEVTAAGAARYADPATGEVHDVPGVELRPSRAAGHRMTYSRPSKTSALTGRDLVAQAWRESGLAAHVLPALAQAAPAQAAEDTAA
ncbi:hypothetical protein ACIBAC_15040 [Streptomyces sp. NPDC051362]|uniref:hypothetical protein n=1 Tax=Streptomyces sp. NPDC051362 TaxID=3365651 RepID=UPI00379CB6F3